MIEWLVIAATAVFIFTLWSVLRVGAEADRAHSRFNRENLHD